MKSVHDQSTKAGEDIPMICETCLGPNPYVRMTKLPFGSKLCKISNLPYQGFRWKAGPNGRHKETIISYAVALEKNICQTCLNDMRFNLPVGVRDKVLKRSLHASSNNSQAMIAQPQSILGNQLRYLHAQENPPDIVNESELQLQEYQQYPQIQQLDQLSKSIHNPWSGNDHQLTNNGNNTNIQQQTAFRNLPKLCTFWLNGACTRVTKKSCPFRPCCGVFIFPEIAKSAPEQHKQLQALLTTEGPEKVQKTLPKEIRQAIQQGLKTGNRNEAIKKRVLGEDELSKSYLRKLDSLNGIQYPSPPDENCKTLWIGNLDPTITNSNSNTILEELKSIIYPAGIYTSFQYHAASKCVFVEYATQALAKEALIQLYPQIILQSSLALPVHWARPKQSSLDANKSSADPQAKKQKLMSSSTTATSSNMYTQPYPTTYSQMMPPMMMPPMMMPMPMNMMFPPNMMNMNMNMPMNMMMMMSPPPPPPLPVPSVLAPLSSQSSQSSLPAPPTSAPPLPLPHASDDNNSSDEDSDNESDSDDSDSESEEEEDSDHDNDQGEEEGKEEDAANLDTTRTDTKMNDNTNNTNSNYNANDDTVNNILGSLLGDYGNDDDNDD